MVRRVPVETIYAVDTGALIGWLDCHVWHMVSKKYPGQQRSFDVGTWATPEQAASFEAEHAQRVEAWRQENMWINRAKRWITNLRGGKL